MSDQNIKPSRWYYALAAIVFIIGSALFGWFLFNNLSGLTDRLTQVIVPGTTVITLKEPGKYTVFYEYQSVVGNRVYSTGQDLSGLECALISRVTGSSVPLYSSSMNSTYSIGGRSGISVLDFTIAEAGTYEFSAWYPEGQEGPQIVLAIGHGFTGKLLKIILGSLAMLFVSIAIGVGIALVTFSKRRRAKEQVQL